MTSTSITDFLISLAFIGMGVGAVLSRLRQVNQPPLARDHHEVIPRGGRRGSDGPR